MANLEVDAERLREEGDQFNNMASIAYSIYGFLARGAAMIHIPRDDEISRQFGKQWDDLMNPTKGLLLSFNYGMSDTATNVNNTAVIYEKSNIDNAESITPPPIIHR